MKSMSGSCGGGLLVRNSPCKFKCSLGLAFRVSCRGSAQLYSRAALAQHKIQEQSETGKNGYLDMTNNKPSVSRNPQAHLDVSAGLHSRQHPLRFRGTASFSRFRQLSLCRSRRPAARPRVETMPYGTPHDTCGGKKLRAKAEGCGRNRPLERLAVAVD